MKNNALFPWFILVPEVEGVEDPHELPLERYQEVMLAVREVSGFVSAYFKPEKLNTGCIGNQVRQMHFQIVGRSNGDPVWPGTVGGYERKESYPEERAREIVEAAREGLLG